MLIVPSVLACWCIANFLKVANEGLLHTKAFCIYPRALFAGLSFDLALLTSCAANVQEQLVIDNDTWLELVVSHVPGQIPKEQESLSNQTHCEATRWLDTSQDTLGVRF